MAVGQHSFSLKRSAQPRMRSNPTWDLAPIVHASEFAPGIVRFEIYAPTVCRSAHPGQFVMLNFPDTERQMVLPRPMAIHRRHPSRGTIEIIVKVFGRGTQSLSELVTGESLFVMGPLGRGFEIPPVRQALVMSRGIGTCSVMTLGEEFGSRGIDAHFVLSARTPETVIGLEDCAELRLSWEAIDDQKGNSSVQDLLSSLIQRFDNRPPQAIYSCGSNRLAALALELGERWNASTLQVSVESHMACGLGYCHGCPAEDPVDAIHEPPLVCMDGPVFDLVRQQLSPESLI